MYKSWSLTHLVHSRCGTPPPVLLVGRTRMGVRVHCSRDRWRRTLRLHVLVFDSYTLSLRLFSRLCFMYWRGSTHFFFGGPDGARYKEFVYSHKEWSFQIWPPFMSWFLGRCKKGDSQWRTIPMLFWMGERSENRPVTVEIGEVTRSKLICLRILSNLDV